MDSKMDEEQRREFRHLTRMLVHNGETILFEKRHISDVEINFAIEKIATDDKIKKIIITVCSLDSEFQRLMDILKDNKNVEYFECRESWILRGEQKDFIEFINTLLRGDNNITKLLIPNMNIGSDSYCRGGKNYKNYEKFVELLKNNKTLEILDISYNGLTPYEIKYLIDELEDNDTLQELVLRIGVWSREEEEKKLKYYLAINDAYRQLKKGGEVIIKNNELRNLINTLFLCFSVRNAATGKMTDIIPTELKYEIAKNFVLELKYETYESLFLKHET